MTDIRVVTENTELPLDMWYLVACVADNNSIFNLSQINSELFGLVLNYLVRNPSIFSVSINENYPKLFCLIKYMKINPLKQTHMILSIINDRPQIYNFLKENKCPYNDDIPTKYLNMYKPKVILELYHPELIIKQQMTLSPQAKSTESISSNSSYQPGKVYTGCTRHIMQNGKSYCLNHHHSCTHCQSSWMCCDFGHQGYPIYSSTIPY
jgi:hypothetical protein